MTPQQADTLLQCMVKITNYLQHIDQSLRQIAKSTETNPQLPKK